MFGYFLRRVDKRFQLERSIGSLPLSKDDAVARLEKLFSMAEAEEPPMKDSGKASSTTSESDSAVSEPSPSSSSEGSSSNLPVKKEKSALRRYVEVGGSGGGNILLGSVHII